MASLLEETDKQFRNIAQRVSLPMTRLALFVVYFWFGILKILDTSPANPLVAKLLHATLPFLTFHQFIIFFSIFEMVIGICFLIPRLNRLGTLLILPHLFTTVLPLFVLPEVTWQKFLTPTLEGQYIIKNLLIISAALVLYSATKPYKQKSK